MKIQAAFCPFALIACLGFGGIKVGRVTTVPPDTDDPTRIEIAFEVKAGTRTISPY